MGHKIEPTTVAAAERGVLAVVLALLATAGFVATTTATLSAKTTNATSTFATSALYAPASVSGAPSGHGVSVTWPAGTNGNGYNILGVANGTTSTCTSGLAYASLGTSASTSYTDTTRFSPQGNYFCYQVQTKYNSSWTSVNSNPFTATGVQIGFVGTGVTLTNGGTAGTAGTGDIIVLTFNQAVNTGSGAPSGAVCSYGGGAAGSTPGTSDTLWLGTTATTGSCTATETVSVGSLVGGTLGTASTDRFNATYAFSNGNKTLTITIGTAITGTAKAMSTGVWTFHPTTDATKLLSSTGSFHICDSIAGGATCFPSSSSSAL